MSEADATLRVRLTLGAATFEADGSEETVRELYDQFREGLKPGAIARASTAASSSPISSPNGADEEPEADAPVDHGSGELSVAASEAKRLPLAGFLALFVPKTNVHRAALIATWLTHSENLGSVSVQDIETRWKRTRWQLPKNLSRDVSKAEHDGYLEKRGRANYAVTGYGEARLEEIRKADG